MQRATWIVTNKSCRLYNFHLQLCFSLMYILIIHIIVDRYLHRSILDSGQRFGRRGGEYHGNFRSTDSLTGNDCGRSLQIA